MHEVCSAPSRTDASSLHKLTRGARNYQTTSERAESPHPRLRPYTPMAQPSPTNKAPRRHGLCLLVHIRLQLARTSSKVAVEHNDPSSENRTRHLIIALHASRECDPCFSSYHCESKAETQTRHRLRSKPNMPNLRHKVTAERITTQDLQALIVYRRVPERTNSARIACKKLAWRIASCQLKETSARVPGRALFPSECLQKRCWSDACHD